MSMAVAALRCHGLTRSFGSLRAVDRVNLEVSPGSRHALIGPNGAGKSTLFHLITGGLRADAGTVELDGRDVTRLSQVRRSRLGIASTVQQASLFPSLTAAQTVALAVQRHQTRDRSVLWRRVADMLAWVGLGDRGGLPVSTLSHGERKQLEIALAVACRPRLLLLDEPAAGLSAGERQRLAQLLVGLPPEVTVLFVDHDLDLVFHLADTVTVLHLGKVLFSGSPEQARASEAVRAAYLGAKRQEELFTPRAGAADAVAGA